MSIYVRRRLCEPRVETSTGEELKPIEKKLLRLLEERGKKLSKKKKYSEARPFYQAMLRVRPNHVGATQLLKELDKK